MCSCVCVCVRVCVCSWVRVCVCVCVCVCVMCVSYIELSFKNSIHLFLLPKFFFLSIYLSICQIILSHYFYIHYIYQFVNQLRPIENWEKCVEDYIANPFLKINKFYRVCVHVLACVYSSEFVCVLVFLCNLGLLLRKSTFEERKFVLRQSKLKVLYMLKINIWNFRIHLDLNADHCY